MSEDRAQHADRGWGRFGLILWAVFLLLGGWGLAHLLTLTARTARASEAEPVPRQPLAEQSICGSITSDVTWAASTLYIANDCTVIIESGVTVTVEPGTAIKFRVGSSAFIVRGTLLAAGSAAAPIAITSFNDDAHGVPASGSSGSPAVGDWYGIYFEPGSTGSLEHVFVGYGGSGAWNDVGGWNKAHIWVRGAFSMQASQVQHGGRVGIYLEGAGLTPTLADVEVTGHSDGSSRAYAVYQSTINMQPSYANLTLSGNDRDQVIISFDTAISQDVTLGGAEFGFVCGYTLCLATVPNAVTLTVAPGTFLDFEPEYGITVAAGGALMAEGTPTQPITFTSRLAAQTSGQEWIGLWAQNGSTLRLNYCDISYATNTNFGKGGLEISTDDALVRNCKLHHNLMDGLYISSSNGGSISPILENVDITDNGSAGLYLDAWNGSAISVGVEGGSISRNGFSGVVGTTSGSAIYPTLRNVTISGNGIAAGSEEWRGRGISFEGNYSGIHPVLEDLTITDNLSAAITWYCDGSIMAHHITASGNGSDVLMLPGCTVYGRQWDLGDVGIPVQVTNNIVIPADSFLSILPGVELHFATDKRVLMEDRSALYALGSAERPVVLTGIDETPGAWMGIYAGYQDISLILSHCEIAYGGGANASANLHLSGSWGVDSAPVILQNCELHGSASRGLYSEWTFEQPPVVRYNSIHDNAMEGVANSNSTPLDARNNWWGNASGPYHATLNPGGLGETVGDQVLFDPWLEAPPEGSEVVSGMLLRTVSPTRVSPGQTSEYAIHALNLMTQTVQNGILVIQLPQIADYLDSTQGGIYWPERHQVFWKLGNLAPGAQKLVSARLRFDWGLPVGYTDGSLTLLAGDNYQPDVLNLDEYNAYEAALLSDTALLEQADFDALRAEYTSLEALYQQALASGYEYVETSQATYEDGDVVAQTILSRPDRLSVRILTQLDTQSLAYTMGGDQFTIHDATGGMTTTVSTGEREFWGSWLPEVGLLAGGQAPAACSTPRCIFNCMMKNIVESRIKDKIRDALIWSIFSGGLGTGVKVGLEVYDFSKALRQCERDCQKPESHCCKEGDAFWYPTGLKQQCRKMVCSTLGDWRTDYIEKCGFGERCVAGFNSTGGCKECEPELLLLERQVTVIPGVFQPCSPTALPGCRGLEITPAKDPNALYGPQGDLLPEQTLAYTITFENEGAGRAYGVYVINELPEVFDESTLDLHGKGNYLPLSREIFWYAGELGPKGDPDSQGVITYSVQLKSGLPSGTVVSNQAVVYFPSVPEETPTDAWVNTVAPLAAIPQDLAAAYRQALAILLAGREVSGLPLTFEIVEYPRGGRLQGAAPNLTYTPLENFTGVDDFAFQVSNGVSTSRPAQVRITVDPAGDSTSPQVRWVAPQNGQVEVPVGVEALYYDEAGPVYTPSIVAGFSEQLDETSVTSQTVTLEDGNGQPVDVSVAYDPGLYQIVIRLHQALAGQTTYTITFMSGITDLAGNALSGAPYTWSFTTALLPVSQHDVYLPLIQK